MWVWNIHVRNTQQTWFEFHIGLKKKFIKKHLPAFKWHSLIWYCSSFSLGMSFHVAKNTWRSVKKKKKGINLKPIMLAFSYSTLQRASNVYCYLATWLSCYISAWHNKCVSCRQQSKVQVKQFTHFAFLDEEDIERDEHAEVEDVDVVFYSHL